MIIDVDLTGERAVVALVEPEDCRRFHVAVRGGDPAALGEALSGAEVGQLLSSAEAMISVAAIRHHAAGRVPAGWNEDFAAMLGYASSKGWLYGTGSAVRAHIEWSP